MNAKKRDSGIETLKVIAIFLIVFSHVSQTLGGIVNLGSYHNLQFTLLSIFRQFGGLGNSIFFVSSAWFLLKSEKAEPKKCASIIAEVWTVSVIILSISYILLHGEIKTKYIIRSLLPNTYATNWYLTCFLVFYMVHPLLNRLIRQLDQKSLFRFSLTGLIIYTGFAFIFEGSYLYSHLILWTVVYFTIAYLQKYVTESKVYKAMFAIGIAGFVGMPVAFGILGLHISKFSNKMTFGARNNNPFLILIAISAFMLFKNIHFHSRLINGISKLSMLVYLIHENHIIRAYFRPALVRSVYEKYGESYVFLEVLVLSVLVFLFSLAMSWIYSVTLRKPVSWISSKCLSILKKPFLMIEKRVLPLKNE